MGYTYEMDDAFLALVSDIIRDTATAEILPRFRALSANQVQSKTSANDLVTEADILAEQRLSVLLTEIMPESMVVGEEGCHADPDLIRAIGTAPLVWVVDPLDGTANFVSGNPVFATVVALVRDGVTMAGWLHDPVNDVTLCGYRGNGVIRNGVRVRLEPHDRPLSERTGSPGANTPKSLQGRFAHNIRHGSAAHDYMALISGRIEFAAFRRLAPWDHAAGVLLYEEAGGISRFMDGSPYSPSIHQGFLIAAQSRMLWNEIAEAFRSAAP